MEKTKIDKDKKLNAKSSTLDNLETKSSYCRIPMSIFKDDRLTKKDISVLLTICSYLNNKKGEGYNTCYPSRASIAKRSGYNRADEIDDSINNLLGYGYIIKTPRVRGVKAQTSNLYTVIFSFEVPNPDTPKMVSKYEKRKLKTTAKKSTTERTITRDIAPVVPEPVAPAETPKPVKKIVRKNKAPIDKQELSKKREQAIELINSWNYSLRENEYTHHEEVNERNISYAMKALEQYDLPRLKELAEHIWGGEWTRPKGIRAININIFNSDALMNSIIQSYETQIKETADRKKPDPKALREWRDPDEKSKSKAYIVRPRTYIE